MSRFLDIRLFVRIIVLLLLCVGFYTDFEHWDYLLFVPLVVLFYCAIKAKTPEAAADFYGYLIAKSLTYLIPGSGIDPSRDIAARYELIGEHDKSTIQQVMAVGSDFVADLPPGCQAEDNLHLAGWYLAKKTGAYLQPTAPANFRLIPGSHLHRDAIRLSKTLEVVR